MGIELSNVQATGPASGVGDNTTPAQLVAGETNRPGETPKSVYIVDQFAYPDTNLNRSDSYADISHGELVARTYESLSGETATRIEYMSPSVDEGVLDLAHQVNSDHPSRDFSNVIINLSWHSDGLGQRAEAALTDLINQGATVYVAAGNDPAMGPNRLSDIDGVITVGANNGVIGGPDSGQPIAEYPTNAETDVFANGVIDANPIANKKGEFVGVDINGDGRVDVPAKQITGAYDPQGLAATVQQFEGRSLAGNEVSYEAFSQYFNQIQAGQQPATNPTTDKVINLGALNANNDLNGIKLPPGIAPENVYISADDAAGDSYSVTFFEVDASAQLQRLSDVGDGIQIRGTSFASPNAAAADALSGARPVDNN